ncbi:T9SS type A sorting domain-containing protein [bacterium]|nr:T9SS type A sorting domain-containing protein [bacterium]
MIILLSVLIAFLAQPLAAQAVTDLWNIDSIVDYSWMDVETLWTADTSIINSLGSEIIPLKVGEIMFSSFGADSGELRIQGFFAYPSSGTNLTGLVINHGMIMDGELSMAETFAAGLNSFTLAISAPGHGTSTGGSAYNFENLIWSYPNPRNNHFYQFAYATMRAINYMDSLTIVNSDWLGVIGFSGGADAAIIASGIDDRIAICIPIIPQTNFACGAADSGWIIDVFAETGISPDDSNVVYLENFISPINYFDYIDGFTVMITASQDEFEPLNCVAYSFPLLDSSRSRLEIVPNFDHHCYFTTYALTGDYDSFDNTTTFYSKILGISNSVIDLLKLGSPVPRMPSVEAFELEDSVEFVADVPVEYWASNDVKLWFSVDSAWTFDFVQMENEMPDLGEYSVMLPRTRANSLENIIYYVESRCTPIFWLSSLPHVPDDMVFNLRPFPRLFFGLDIKETKITKPDNIYLHTYPNPFNSSVKISIETQDFAPLQIEIFDLIGQKIEVLYPYATSLQKKEYPGGANEIIWTPNEHVKSGIYLIRIYLDSGETALKRIVYLK